MSVGISEDALLRERWRGGREREGGGGREVEREEGREGGRQAGREGGEALNILNTISACTHYNQDTSVLI